MRKLIFSVLVMLTVTAPAQNNTAATIIEGSKALVDLVRVFKTPKNLLIQSPVSAVNTDSCNLKSLADICYKNTSGKPITVSIYKRNGAGYEAVPFILRISNNNQECLYELKAGIYKYRIEADDEKEEKDIKKIVLKEGEIKLKACDKIKQDIAKQ